MAAPICLVCPLVRSLFKGLGADTPAEQCPQPSTGPLIALVSELTPTRGSA